MSSWHFLVFVVTIFFNSCLPSAQSSKGCSIAECINNGNDDVSSVILCNSCLGKILLNTDATMLFHEAQRKVNRHGQTKIYDLNTDVLRIIFDDLHILQIMNLFEAYPAATISIVANDIFWKKYKDYVVYITSEGPWLTDRIKFDEITKRVIVGREAPMLLKCFGSAIRYLKMDYLSVMAMKYINKYASDSLITLNMVNVHDNPFEYFKKPFRALEVFTMTGRTAIKAKKMAFNQIFPNLRRLSMLSISDIDESFIAGELPHLEHLHLTIGNLRKKDNIFGLLRTNEQIRNITIDILSQDLSIVISEHVPNIVNLSISTFDLENETCFEHVKLLKIGQNAGNFGKMLLPQLEELEIEYSYNISTEWTEFFSKHQHVKRLKILDSHLHDLQINMFDVFLLKCSYGFPNLIEVTIECYDRSIKPYFIQKFIASNSKLEKIKCFSCSIPVDGVDTLRRDHGNDWIISAIPQYGSIKELMVERKKLN